MRAKLIKYEFIYSTLVPSQFTQSGFSELNREGGARERAKWDRISFIRGSLNENIRFHRYSERERWVLDDWLNFSYLSSRQFASSIWVLLNLLRFMGDWGGGEWDNKVGNIFRASHGPLLRHSRVLCYMKRKIHVDEWLELSQLRSAINSELGKVIVRRGKSTSFFYCWKKYFMTLFFIIFGRLPPPLRTRVRELSSRANWKSSRKLLTSSDFHES